MFLLYLNVLRFKRKLHCKGIQDIILVQAFGGVESLLLSNQIYCEISSQGESVHL